MSKTKVFIGGDSWGCGEWPDGPSLHATHKGIEEYFSQDGYHVINTSRGGSSNRDSISLLSSAINDVYSANDIVIWVQSDPIRNLVKKQLPQAVEQAGGIQNLMRQLCLEDYNSLNLLTLKYNCTVYAIGGLYNIQTDLLVKYPGVKCLVESWVKLLIPNWNESAILDSAWTVDDLKLHTFKDQNLAGQCIDELTKFEANRRVYKDPLFHPNGNHPNRDGHKILYNYIKEKLTL